MDPAKNLPVICLISLFNGRLKQQNTHAVCDLADRAISPSVNAIICVSRLNQFLLISVSGL
jgi:hypothetical protein